MKPDRDVQPPSDWSLLWSFVVARRRAILRSTFILAAVGVAGIGLLGGLTVAGAPWAWSFGLWPTLAGDWTGTLESPDGGAQPVFFAIRGDVPRRLRGRVRIDGRARLCEGSDAIRPYELSGGPDNWRGTKFHMSMSSDHDAGLGPGDLQGEWEGDAIRATGVVVSRGPVATAEATRESGVEAPTQVRYLLRRGSENEFLAACRALTRRN